MTKKADLPEFFFDSNRGGYWLRLASGRFLFLTTEQTRLHLRAAGLEDIKTGGLALNEVEGCLYEAQTTRNVDYAGPLAGHRVGLWQTTAGNNILVTSEPAAAVFTTDKDERGFAFLENFLAGLFGSQLPYCLAWLKVARASLRAGDFRPGQLLVLAGPSDCGKSLFQALVTEFLGGRVARPYRYMIGETAFNADLAAAEHLVIEDEHASTDIRARRKFGASLKDFTVNREMSIHGKGRQAVTLPTFKRLTLSVNDEPENLMILPPLDSSILDKVMLFKCSKASLPDDRRANWDKLTAQLPALAVHLQGWRIPERMKDCRFGVKGFHNQELLQVVSDISPESRLLNLVEEICGGVFEGSSEELENKLRKSEFTFAVEKLLYFSSACGVYLARLAAKLPDRISCRKVGGRALWSIQKGSGS